MQSESKTNPIVFISYAHEGQLGERVRELAAYLTENGVQVLTDHPYRNRAPEKGWRTWMQHSIEDADLVLIVCTERYRKLFEKREIPDQGGRGVTWESAIITDDLYSSHLCNTRFYPVLPEGGLDKHVPTIVKDWHNNLCFPSGKERILALICEEIRIPQPQGPLKQYLSGELTGSDDNRIQPREDEVLGRTDEIHEVLNFLQGSGGSAAVCGHITGSGGIGKTEVCKAALKQWLSHGKPCRVFWVAVNDQADALRLLGQLGEAIDLPPETQGLLTTCAQLRQYLPQGLYYLDNLESVAESSGGVQLLRELSQIPGIRLLASSRVSLAGVLGRSIEVNRLDNDSAVKLFQKCWNGGALPNETEIRDFVDQQLGGHALSITLLARLGRSYGWSKLKTQWQEQGTAFAQHRNPSGRMDSLELSFSLTAQCLAQEAGVSELWQFAALFPAGFTEQTLSAWGKISQNPQARVAMAEHHLFSIQAGYVSMLPPIARYALEQVHPRAQTPRFFPWESTRQHAYQYFMDLSQHASDTISSEVGTQARVHTAKYFWAIENLLKTDIAWGDPQKELAQQLHGQLRNAYNFNVMGGRAVLHHMQQMLGDTLSELKLGDLERRLGQVEAARAHYDEAISFYQKEQDPAGLAYTLSEIIRCDRVLQCFTSDELKKIALEAFFQAERSGFESITHYVMGALFEYFDEDKEKWSDFLQSIGVDVRD